MRDLQAASAGGDLVTVRKLTHQLKGSAGSYGFPRISEVAARAESLIDDGTDESALATALGELTTLLLGASREASGESA